MGYPEQFQSYRESRRLSREQLATRADCHRNTVINVESGRPVRFATIVHLMQHLGYSKHSPEVKGLALLWLEAVTGIRMDQAEAERIAGDGLHSSNPVGDVSPAALSRSDVELLSYAARNRKVLNALRAIRDLVGDSTPTGA